MILLMLSLTVNNDEPYVDGIVNLNQYQRRNYELRSFRKVNFIDCCGSRSINSRMGDIMPKTPPLKIEMSAYSFDDIIMKETEKFCKEYPEQVEKAMWKDNFSHLAFKILANVIRKRMVDESITHCPRCNKVTRADILHTCSPGDWKPVKAEQKQGKTGDALHLG